MQCDCVKPPTAPLTTGGSAKLMAFFTQILADFAVQFGGERPGPNTCSVGLGDTQNLIDIEWSKTGSSGGTTGSGIR